MVVYKTASTMGSNDIFESFSEYHEAAVKMKEAHRIIEIDKVEELRGKEIEVEVDGWGNKNLIVDGVKFTITRFFNKYRY